MLVRYLYTFPFFHKRKTSKTPLTGRENVPDTEVFEILSGIHTYYLQINLLKWYHFSRDKGLKAVLIWFLLTKGNIIFNPCRPPI